MKIQALCILNSGIHHHRIVNPLAYMPQDDSIEVEILQQHTDEQKIDCDILLYNKYCMTEPRFIRKLQANGMKVALDVDDMWHLPQSHPSYQLFKENSIGEITEEHIRLADVVICTTMRLQDKIRATLNKNTVVIPNALPFNRDQYVKGDRVRGREISGNEKTRFMYLTGSTHKEDVKMLDGKFTRIGGDPFMTANAEFILCGYNPTKAKIYNTKEDMLAKNDNYKVKEVNGEYDFMATTFRKTNSFKIYPSVDLDYYLNYYDSADVALAPLVKNEWNSYKSELKVIEAGCKHVPIMASYVPPYSDVVEFNNEGVMFVKTPDDWIKTMKFCVKNPNFVTDQGEKLYELTSDIYDLIKWNVTRKQVFESLVK